ncbi:MAG: PQQ-like beta-propeller repeat protein [Candidatus Hydrogenedentes bacterium]|nr:PQQ-like beta-propeller repeat protein [Candidatus Hydrogenedentota bacterium]
MARLCAVPALIVLAAAANAADAPQFRGPDRTGHFEDTGLLKAWPEGGPALHWEVDFIGMGYASPTVVGDTIYVPGMLEGDQGVLFALNLDGSEKWRLPYGLESDDSQAPGARSTLTVEGDAGYLISGPGVVYRFDLKTPAITWRVDLMDRFNGTQIQWDIAESPLVDERYVYCAPGGPDAGLAALDKHTGETAWTSKGFSDPSAYCSPDIIVHNGRRILVSMSAKGLVGANPDTGEVLWTRDHPDRWDIHANTPVYENGILFFVAGSQMGGVALRLSEDGSEITPIWTDTEMDTLHGGVVLKDGYIYGTSHRSGREIFCFNLETGEIMWRSPDVAESAIVYADGMLYAYEGPAKGIVNLVRATPEKFERTGHFKVEKGDAKHWAHPVIADGRLYIRRGEYLWSYDIAAK